MIKVDLITGSLGSGKTTFLLRYARHLMNKDLRIGILEYDYGSVNVDMLLLNRLRGKQCELEMVAAACDQDCLRRRFSTKLIAMAMSGYDRVIIEPSGVFDMDMFFDELREEPLEKWYEIGSVITVVNAGLSEELSEEEDFLLASQASDAGCIVLSRTQLTDESHIEATKAHVARAAKKIKCNKYKGEFLEKNWDELTEKDFDYLMNCGYRINDYIKVIAGKELEFNSVSFIDIKDDLNTLRSKIKCLFEEERFGEILRVKGFVIDGGVSYQINATAYEMLVDPIAIGQGVLIVIGRNINSEGITELLKGE